MADEDETISALAEAIEKLEATLDDGVNTESAEMVIKLPKYGSKDTGKDITTKTFSLAQPAYSVRGLGRSNPSGGYDVFLAVVSSGNYDKYLMWPINMTWAVFLVNDQTKSEKMIGQTSSFHGRPRQGQDGALAPKDGIKVTNADLLSAGYQDSGATVSMKWSVRYDDRLATKNTSMIMADVRQLRSLAKILADFQLPKGNKISVRMDLDKTIDILVVGKTGNGKSALCNSIIRRRLFQSESSMTSVTTKLQTEYSEFSRREIKVVDSPGVCDTSKSDDEVIQAIKEAIAANPQGYHAIVLVIRFGTRFTEEDKRAIEVIKQIFGKDFVKDYFVVVLTCGDEYEKSEGSRDPVDWCQAKGEPEFKKLINECQERLILFDNATEDEMKQVAQMRRFVKVIEKMRLRDQRYTNDEFAKAQKVRDELIRSAKFPIIREESMKELSLIQQQMHNLNNDDPPKELRKLNDLLKRTNSLYISVKEQDGGSNALKDTLKNIKRTQETLKEQIELFTELKADMDRRLDRQKEKEQHEKQREKERADRQREQEAEKRREEQRRLEEEQRRREEARKIEELRKKTDELERDRRLQAEKNESSLVEGVVQGVSWGIKKVGQWIGWA